MSGVITQGTVMAGRLLNTGHGDAKDWFADFWRHSTLPRLSVADRIPRGHRVPSSPAMGRVWQVDGADCASLEEAIERLNVPPVLTEAEVAFLERIPADWTEFRGFMEPMKGQEFAPNCSAHGMVHILKHKGVVEVERREAVKASFIRRRPHAEHATPKEERPVLNPTRPDPIPSPQSVNTLPAVKSGDFQRP